MLMHSYSAQEAMEMKIDGMIESLEELDEKLAAIIERLRRMEEALGKGSDGSR
jgi:hypothetical protein